MLLLTHRMGAIISHLPKVRGLSGLDDALRLPPDLWILPFSTLLPQLLKMKTIVTITSTWEHLVCVGHCAKIFPRIFFYQPDKTPPDAGYYLHYRDKETEAQTG